jgi:hypothetical protein
MRTSGNPKLTLDMNCIIDLEKNNSYAPDLLKLVELNIERKIDLRITAASASEQKPDDTSASNFSEFKDRLARIGLSSLEILPTLLYVGVSYIGYCLVGGGKLSELEESIQQILFPQVELGFSDYCKKRGLALDDQKAWRRWVNRKCDVLGMFSHIWHNGDLFVTRDSNFHKEKNKLALIRLGAGNILTPQNAVRLIDEKRVPDRNCICGVQPLGLKKE